MKVQVTDGNPSVYAFIPDMPFSNPLVPKLALKQAIAANGRWLIYAGTKPVFFDRLATGWYSRWQYIHPKTGLILDVWECRA